MVLMALFVDHSLRMGDLEAQDGAVVGVFWPLSSSDLAYSPNTSAFSPVVMSFVYFIMLLHPRC